MSEQTSDSEVPAKDPKELMREALERKKNAAHFDADGTAGGSKVAGGPHAKQGGKRQFRRKSGG